MGDGQVLALGGIFDEVVEGNRLIFIGSFLAFLLRFGGAVVFAAIGRGSAADNQFPFAHPNGGAGRASSGNRKDGIMGGGRGLREKRPDIQPVDGQFLFERAARQFNQRGVPIDHVHRFANALTGGDVPRPRSEGCGTSSAFVDRAFEVTERGVVAGRRAAVVAGEDDERVLEQAGFAERIFDLGDGFIDRGEHAGELLAITFERSVRLQIIIRDLEGSVHAVERHIKEEGFRLIGGFDNFAGFLSDQVRRVAFFLEWLAVAIPVELVHALMGIVVEHPEKVSVLVVKATGVRLIGFLEFTEVPFARERGVIPGRAKRIGQGAFRQRKSPGGAWRDDGVDAGMRRVAAGHQCRAGRRADGLDVVMFEDRAALGESVDVRRLDFRAAVEAAVGVAQVVDQ